MERPLLVRVTGFGLSGIFAAVGIVFLAIPDKVLAAFNRLASGLNWPLSSTDGHTLYLALAVAYMYVVTLLAWKMARHPKQAVYAALLVHAKAASAVLCLGLFVFQETYLLYLLNLIVDAGIALLVWWICLRHGART